MSPKRIQMTRQRPWRAENPDAVRVDRGTKWGNPFIVGSDVTIRGHGGGGQDAQLGLLGISPSTAVYLYRLWITHASIIDMPFDPTRLHLGELAGRDLACWCPVGRPCHADVLLELANPEESR